MTAVVSTSALMPTNDFSSESRLARCVGECSLKVAEHAVIMRCDAVEQLKPAAGSNRGDARSGAKQGSDRAPHWPPHVYCVPTDRMSASGREPLLLAWSKLFGTQFRAPRAASGELKPERGGRTFQASRV